MKLMTADLAHKLRLAQQVTQHQELPETEREVVVKYFTPDASCTWFILDGEREQDGDWRLFGLCDLGLGFPELGYVQLSELQAIRGGIGLPVERDLYWRGSLADARNQVRS